ncbi:FAD-dependent 5-carboxymethylaminomethyl-2-thiouridine(34) oxidoreductase MnmC [Shewanella maritima]|uniref:FAD-dependent 5-carboxymethylaminomethyl-2-thiouridine(34) oxidoreductase MnmC n=1 Tax=Shewanella maritima TaxID=2520507 RepID=UPI0037369601
MLGLISNQPMAGLSNILSLFSQHLAVPKDNRRTHLSIFCQTPIEQTLNSSIQQILAEPSHIEVLRHLQAHIAPIHGCQRFHFRQLSLTIDIYQEDALTQLKSISNTTHGIKHWFYCLDSESTPLLNQAIFWQLARLSHDDAQLSVLSQQGILCSTSCLTKGENTEASSNNDDNSPLLCAALTDEFAALNTLCTHVGLPINDVHNDKSGIYCDPIAQAERVALRTQQASQSAHCPLPTSNKAHGDKSTPTDIAIIGGGIASAFLALSLAERGCKVTLYCKDEALAQGASGNKQGAIYPLLTPDNGPLSQFFQQAFLYSRRRIQALVDNGFNISHQFCGVLHTGFDQRSEQRLQKIIDGQQWPQAIAQPVNAKQASQLAGVAIDRSGLYYPNGGWVCPYELAQAAIEQAKQIADVTVVHHCHVTELTPHGNDWRLYTETEAQNQHNQPRMVGQHQHVVIASGAQLNNFDQTQALPLSPFRGQVSHIPSQGELTQLQTVICANGYLTPQHNQQHCVGASYVKNPANIDFCPIEQQQNQQKMQHSFSELSWPQAIDTSDNKARVGVRMVCRDHFPMMGSCPDLSQIQQQYQRMLQSKAKPKTWATYWQTTPAPVHQGLSILGGFGSRGISSAPLTAECLAASLCGEIAPISLPTMAQLNPNRMWMRKLIKGKVIDV